MNRLKSAVHVTRSVESLEGGGKVGRPPSKSKDSTFFSKEVLDKVGEILEKQLKEYNQFSKERDQVREERALLKEKREIERNKGIKEAITEAGKNIALEIKELGFGYTKAQSGYIERLPLFDGTNLEIFEWEEQVRDVMTCNSWSVTHLLKHLPISLRGKAKQAYDNLSPKDKHDEGSLFYAMRAKLDPGIEDRYRTLFCKARRAKGESITSFINRCKTLIKRSGGNPEQSFANDLLKEKVSGNIPKEDERIFKAIKRPTDNLDRLMEVADKVMGMKNTSLDKGSSQFEKSGTESNDQDGSNDRVDERLLDGVKLSSVTNGRTKLRIGPCGRCHQFGHLRKSCPKKKKKCKVLN